MNDRRPRPHSQDATTERAAEQETDQRPRTPTQTGRAWVRRSAAPLWISTGVLVCGALYFASTALVPIAISLLASLALRPVVGRLWHWGLPRGVSAAALLLFFVGLLAFAIAAAAGPAQEWLRAAPQRLSEVSRKLQGVSDPLAAIDEAEQQLDELSQQAGEEDTMEVEIKSPNIIDREVAITNLGHALALLVAIGVLTFFLLATGDDLINRVLHLMPSFGDQRKVVTLIIDTQNAVGHYLGTITLINIGLGICVALAMWALGMPTPMLWGVLATCFNFIPYIGAFGAAAIIFFAAATHFDPLWRAFLTTACFLTLTSLEGQFVTPTILGRTLRIGPVVVLLAITFWGFLWGIAGIFVAVPMLIVARIMCNAFEATRPVAILLGEDPPPPVERLHERESSDDEATDDPVPRSASASSAS